MPKPKQQQKMSTLEMVQCMGKQSIDHLNNVSIEELPAHAALEQVRATYTLATVLARIHEQLQELRNISDQMPMAGRGI